MEKQKQVEGNKSLLGLYQQSSFYKYSLCSYQKCYGENAKNFGLVNIFMVFGCLMAHVTAC